MAVIWSIGGLTLNATECLGQGLVLVPGSDGAFEFREQSNGFARHYGSGGQPIIPEAERQASVPEKLHVLSSRAGQWFHGTTRCLGKP